MVAWTRVGAGGGVKERKFVQINANNILNEL